MTAKFKVGDTVIVEASYNEGRYGQKFWEDKVDKVGRKYAYLHGDGRAYDVQTGHQKPTQYSGSERSIHTPQEWAEMCRRSEVVNALKVRHGIVSSGYRGFDQSLPVLERLLAVLEAAE